ncbi:hypothetical protein Rhopal_000726-T1 [Rhodotorula paludigena]|uniref:TRAF-type domain-containing protein n=1 Tax=Rhodotorula paludigena TaxID=86838 RepID=A0AAV5G5G4_9BASI|nr:hypothetical protein Rhopal_000726-T1 [Rhodotorula paludigena]
MGKSLAQFVDRLPANLQCTACHQAAWPAALVCPQQPPVCNSCSHWVTQNNASTPHPCDWCGVHHVDAYTCPLTHATESEIESFRYRCRYNGCTWVGNVHTEELHVGTCVHRFVTCPRCLCQHRQHRTASHFEVCDAVVVICPRGGRHCGGVHEAGVMTRGRMHNHEQTTCAQHLCKVTPGCTVHGTRASLVAHEAICRFESRVIAAGMQQVCNAALGAIESISEELRAGSHGSGGYGGGFKRSHRFVELDENDEEVGDAAPAVAYQQQVGRSSVGSSGSRGSNASLHVGDVSVNTRGDRGEEGPQLSVDFTVRVSVPFMQPPAHGGKRRRTG